MNLTLKQAKAHLANIRNLCIESNRFLPCVREFVRYAPVDIIHDVRVEHITSYEVLQDLTNDIAETRNTVDKFLGGA